MEARSLRSKDIYLSSIQLFFSMLWLDVNGKVRQKSESLQCFFKQSTT